MVPPKPPRRLERQATMTQAEMLADIGMGATGTTNSNGSVEILMPQARRRIVGSRPQTALATLRARDSRLVLGRTD